MPVARFILIGLLGLVMAEVAAFVLVAWAFGTFVAMLALSATSILGIAVLARMGRRLAGRLADILSQRDFEAPVRQSSGLMTTLAGLLLVMPGFITDCVGMLLLFPAIQRRLISRAKDSQRRPSGRVLELSPGQWRDLPGQRIDERDEAPRLTRRRR